MIDATREDISANAEAMRALMDELCLFLKDRRESPPGGGYAPVTDGDMAGLGRIIELLISLKWDEDADGDPPVGFALCNYHVERKLHPQMISRVHGSPFKQGTAAYDLIWAIHSAASALDQEMQVCRELEKQGRLQ